VFGDGRQAHAPAPAALHEEKMIGAKTATGRLRILQQPLHAIEETAMIGAAPWRRSPGLRPADLA
jgi:hypothetical protein